MDKLLTLMHLDEQGKTTMFIWEETQWTEFWPFGEFHEVRSTALRLNMPLLDLDKRNFSFFGRMI